MATDQELPEEEVKNMLEELEKVIQAVLPWRGTRQEFQRTLDGVGNKFAAEFAEVIASLS